MDSSQERDYRVYLVSRAPFDPLAEQPPPELIKVGAWYIIQFLKPLTLEERKYLRARYDLRLTDYMPNLAFLEWLEVRTWFALFRDELYRASVFYTPADKLSPDIFETSDASVESEARLRFVLFPEEANLNRFLNALGIQLTAAGEGTGSDAWADREAASALAEVDPSQIKVIDDLKVGGDLQVVIPVLPVESVLKLAELKEVRWVEPEATVDMDSAAPLERTPGGLIQSGTPDQTPIWNKEIRGKGQIIGVTDHAMNINHCLFSDQVPVGPEHRKVVGRRQHDFDPSRLHGQRVAALAAGYDPSGQLNNHKGMAWEARLSLDDSNDLQTRTVHIGEVLLNQAADGAFIHSSSFHLKCGYSQNAVVVDSFVWNNEEHFVCGASGNSGECIGPPASAKNALCVSASREAAQKLDFADGVVGPISNSDRRNKPEICAPGCSLSTAAHLDCNTLNMNCECSWAPPIIAGAAALVRQYYAEGWYPTGTKTQGDGIAHPSAALVKATLLNATEPMEKAPRYPSHRTGWGLIQLSKSLFFAEEGTRRLFVRDISNATGLHTDESHTYLMTVRDDSRPLKITLAWSDYPATLPASPPLVNNLDLIVTSPDGRRFLGNHFEGGVSVEGGRPDGINNVEMVIRNQNLHGVWTITVFCAAANGGTGTQGYALVVTCALG
jgi:hypothetical protein